MLNVTRFRKTLNVTKFRVISEVNAEEITTESVKLLISKDQNFRTRRTDGPIESQRFVSTMCL